MSTAPQSVLTLTAFQWIESRESFLGPPKAAVGIPDADESAGRFTEIEASELNADALSIMMRYVGHGGCGLI